MILPGHTCTVCGSPEIMAVSPESERLQAVGITYARGENPTAWCATHWGARFGADLSSIPSAADGHQPQPTGA